LNEKPKNKINPLKHIGHIWSFMVFSTYLATTMSPMQKLPLWKVWKQKPCSRLAFQILMNMEKSTTLMTDKLHKDDDDTYHSSSWLERLTSFIAGEPQNREQLMEILRDAEERDIVSSEMLGMIERILQVSE